MSEISGLEQQLVDLELAAKELERKRAEISGRLKLLTAKEPDAARSLISRQEWANRPLLGVPACISPPVAPPQKVELFLKLFRCRESVFPKLWENKTKEKKGYSPACTNEWVRGVCGKPSFFLVARDGVLGNKEVETLIGTRSELNRGGAARAVGSAPYYCGDRRKSAESRSNFYDTGKMSHE